MDANEKAQRLALITNVKFRLDNKTGEVAESDSTISDAVMREAMDMPDKEFKQRIKAQRKKATVSQYANDLSIRCAFKAYLESKPDAVFEDFVGSVIDQLEAEQV